MDNPADILATMDGRFGVPFHFAVEFLVLVVSLGAALDSIRSRRQGAGPWSLAQAAGFGALAIAQVMHGSLISPADGGMRVLVVRSIGFGLLAVFARPAASVMAPQNALGLSAGGLPALIFPGAAARWALLPGLGAAAVAVRGVRAHRSDQDPATFAFAAGFTAFAFAELAVALASGPASLWLLLAHAARGLGALLLARWLYSSIVRSVRLRFVASFVVVLTVAVLVVSAALNVVIGGTLQREELKRLADAGSARVTSIQSLGSTAVGNAGLIAQSGIRDSIAARREVNLAGVLTLFRSDFIALVDNRGRIYESAGVVGRQKPRVLARTERIALQGSQVIVEALDGRAAASAVPIAVTRSDGTVVDQVVVVGAVPVRPAGRTVGAVVVGFRIDQAFLNTVRFETQAEVTLLSGGAIAETTIRDRAAVQRMVESLAPQIRRAREDRSQVRSVTTIAGVQYVTAFVPVRAADGSVIGMMALSRRSTALANAQRAITRTLFLVTLAAVLLAAMLAWLSGGRVTKPIRSLTAAARELRAGHLHARTRVTSVDEVGTLGTAFNEMADELQRKTGELSTSAETEATLRARIEAILQSMSDGLIAVDGEGMVVTFNHAAEQMLGRRADKAIGHSVADILTGRAADGGSLSDQARFVGSSAGLLKRPNGTTLHVMVTTAPLVDAAGQAVGRVVLVRDVSKERQAERMKSEFLSNVSHELRTPITPIKGFAQMMRTKKLPREKNADYLGKIIASTERLERIVEILVDFSAMEAGRLKPRSEPLDVGALIDGAVKRWKSRASSHQLVQKPLASGMPRILGDPKMVSRSLDELMDNAVKFSPAGGKIEITAQPYLNGSPSRKPSKIVITVRDQGIGIEKGRIGELFKDFQQLDGSDTRSYGGLGLGLAYVRRIATALGGDVSVESRLGKGSSFSLMLPVADITTERTPTKVGAAAVRPAGAGRARGWADESVGTTGRATSAARPRTSTRVASQPSKTAKAAKPAAKAKPVAKAKARTASGTKGRTR